MSWKTFKQELALRIHREDMVELSKAVLLKMKLPGPWGAGVVGLLRVERQCAARHQQRHYNITNY